MYPVAAPASVDTIPPSTPFGRPPSLHSVSTRSSVSHTSQSVHMTAPKMPDLSNRYELLVHPIGGTFTCRHCIQVGVNIDSQIRSVEEGASKPEYYHTVIEVPKRRTRSYSSNARLSDVPNGGGGTGALRWLRSAFARTADDRLPSPADASDYAMVQKGWNVRRKRNMRRGARASQPQQVCARSLFCSLH
jgi:hypothetical protein